MQSNAIDRKLVLGDDDTGMQPSGMNHELLLIITSMFSYKNDTLKICTRTAVRAIPKSKCSLFFIWSDIISNARVIALVLQANQLISYSDTFGGKNRKLSMLCSRQKRNV